MLLTGIGIVLVIGAAVYFFGGKKIQGRMKARGRDAADRFADGIGDVVDDRNEKIHSAKERVGSFRNQIAELMEASATAAAKAQAHVDEAEKYAEMAELAVEEGEDAAAMECLATQQQQEELAQTLLGSVEMMDEQIEELTAQLHEAEGDIEGAERSTATFKARHAALELRERMQSTTAFGGVGELDFGADDDALDRKERLLDAKDKLNQSPGKSAIRDLEKKVADRGLANKLAALKAKKENANA